MHVTLLTAGSRGDVQPYVALGIGLREAGHTVRVAAPVPYETLVREHGLEFAPTAQALGALTSGASWQRWQESGDNLAGFLWGALGAARATGAVIESLIDDYWAASQGTDVIISSSSSIAGPLLAEALGVP
ncbi:MAG TPA: glycosyltransferase, partial [bacterium]|nr:glycosyltransferase [bacterium]